MSDYTDFWKTCETLDSNVRLDLLRYLIFDKNEFPCVFEIAESFDMCVSAVSAYLKKMCDVGLVSSKREERRVYYRAFATNQTGAQTVKALADFFTEQPSQERIDRLAKCIRALSHYRRNAVVNLLHRNPGMDVNEISRQLDMPRTTADRILSQLNKARIVALDNTVRIPDFEPERTLVTLTVSG